MFSSTVKRGALLLGGVAILLIGSASWTFAQTAPTPTPSPTSRSKPHAQQRQAIINLAATKLGLTGDQLSDALNQARKDLGTNQGQPRARDVAKDELAVAGKAIGLTDARVLRQELRGSSLAAVAQKHNVPATSVSSAIKADIDAKIQALVSAGKLKADRAATFTQKADARVDRLMTRQFKAATP